MKFSSFVLLTLALSFTSLFAGGEFAAKIGFKIGDGFTVKSKKIRGSFTKVGSNHFTSKKIRASLAKMTSENETRDEHMRKRFNGKGIVIENIIAKNNKGVAIVKMNNISKKQLFKYKEKNNKINIELQVKLSDYKLKGISYGDIILEDEVSIKGKVDIK